MEPLLWIQMATSNIIASTEGGRQESSRLLLLPLFCLCLPSIFHLMNRFEAILLHSKSSVWEGSPFHGLIRVELKLFPTRFTSFATSFACPALIYFRNSSLFRLVFPGPLSRAEIPGEMSDGYFSEGCELLQEAILSDPRGPVLMLHLFRSISLSLFASLGASCRPLSVLRPLLLCLCQIFSAASSFLPRAKMFFPC